jgi:hypothetical protein
MAQKIELRIRAFFKPPATLKEMILFNLNFNAILWVIGLTLVTIFSLATDGQLLTVNPLQWRAFAVWNAHHSLILFMITGFFLLLWLGDHVAPILAAVALWYAIAWHELDWWIVDFIRMVFVTHDPFNPLWFFGWLSTAAAIALFVWKPLMRAPMIWKYVAGMAAFYVFWFAVGFPITVNFSGPTALYSEVWVSGFEIISWIYALVLFYFLARKAVLRWQGQRELKFNR